LTAIEEKNKVLSILNHIVKEEVIKNVLGLMREETLGASLLKNYWFHFEGKNYLKSVVKPLVKDVIAETKSKSLEIDPTKVSPEESVKNLIKLLWITKKYLTNFYQSIPLFPNNFEIIMKNIYNLLLETDNSSKPHLGLGFSESALQKLGGFLLLRFVCPPIVSPQKYGIVKSYSKEAQRALILISKIIQNIANQVEFEGGEKETYMTITNEFVQDNMPLMMAFLTKLVSEERVHVVSKRDSKKSKKDKAIVLRNSSSESEEDKKTVDSYSALPKDLSSTPKKKDT